MIKLDCPFCRIYTEKKEQILFDSKYSFVILSDPKLMDGHLLVIPKRHVEKLSLLNAVERLDIIELTIKTQEKVLERLADGCDISQHYRPFIPNSKYKVEHLHIHIRPRKLDDELYLKVQIGEKDVFKKTNDEEINKYKNILNK
jgi:diadenosine tetraphosphate (Ap4A) HIT family hydrolase